jgi:inner membrane protein YidH
MADPQTRTRDLLANERTFLAWVRTGAAATALGLAIAKFGSPDASDYTAAGLLVAVGVLGIVEGERRRRVVADAIENDRPMPTGGEVVAAAVLVGALLAALVLVLV